MASYTIIAINEKPLDRKMGRYIQKDNGVCNIQNAAYKAARRIHRETGLNKISFTIAETTPDSNHNEYSFKSQTVKLSGNGSAKKGSHFTTEFVVSPDSAKKW
jgi:hypothetical protein